MPRQRPALAPDSSGENFGPELAAVEEYISDDEDDYPPFQPPGVNATEDELRKVLSCIDFLCLCPVSHLLLL